MLLFFAKNISCLNILLKMLFKSIRVRFLDEFFVSKLTFILTLLNFDIGLVFWIL